MKKILTMIGCVLVLFALTIGLAGCVSPTAFKIHITSPKSGAVVSENPVTIIGKVSGYTRGEVITKDDSLRLAPEVTVNGVRAEVAENGTFSAQVELKEGINTVKAVAMFNNLTTKDTIQLTCTPPVIPDLSVNITSPVDGSTLTDSPATVTGTVSDAEAAVTVNDAEAVLDENGNFSAQVDLTEVNNVITAVATLDTQTADDSINVTYAPPAPPLSIEITAPADNAVFTTDSIVVTGDVSEIGAAVTVNGTAVTVNEDGSYSATITLTEGVNDIEAVATSGDQQATDSIQVTYNPPAPALSVNISSPADGAVSSLTPITVTGTVSDADAAVTVNDAEVVVGQNGNFSAQVALTVGNNVITAVATLGAQNASDSINVIYTSPAPSLSVDITGPADNSVFTTNSITVIGNVSLVGAAVKVNDVDATVNEDKTFSAQITLAEGENTVSAVATLNSQAANDSIKVTYTPPAPALSVEITSPEDGSVSATNSVVVTGVVSDAEAIVKINSLEVVVDEEGNFSTQVSLVKGENTISAVATSGELEATDNVIVTYAGPSLSLEVTTNPLTVTGKVSDPQATVTVNGVEASVAEDGTFSAQVTLVEGVNTITVIAYLDGEETSYNFSVTYTPAE